MKTIDELAWEAYDDDRKLAPKYQTPAQAWIDWFTKGFHKGAESEHAKLTRWNDPKEALPENYPHLLMDQFATKKVLVKYSDGGYRTARRYVSGLNGWKWSVFSSLCKPIIGWREVHE